MCPARLRGRGELEDDRRELQRVPALSHGASRARQGRPAVPLGGAAWDDEMRDGGNDMAEGATWFAMKGDVPELPTLPGLLPEDPRACSGSYQFPNLMLNLHPDCVMYYLGFPKGPSHTTVVSEYLFPPDIMDRDPHASSPSRSWGSGTSSRSRTGRCASEPRRASARARSRRASTRARTGSCTRSTGSYRVRIGHEAARLTGSTRRIALGQQANSHPAHARQPFHLRGADVEGGLRVEGTEVSSTDAKTSSATTAMAPPADPPDRRRGS